MTAVDEQIGLLGSQTVLTQGARCQQDKAVSPVSPSSLAVHSEGGVTKLCILKTHMPRFHLSSPSPLGHLICLRARQEILMNQVDMGISTRITVLSLTATSTVDGEKRSWYKIHSS